MGRDREWGEPDNVEWRVACDDAEWMLGIPVKLPSAACATPAFDRDASSSRQPRGSAADPDFFPSGEQGKEKTSKPSFTP